MSFTLNGKSIELPKEFTDSVFLKASEESLVARLSGQTPLTLAGATVPIYTGGISAGIVAEGANAPVGDAGVSLKYINPKKVSVVIPVSKEMASANPGDLMAHVKADLSAAIGRALDDLTLHAKDSISGAPVAGYVALTATSNEVELVGADYKSAILAGFDLVGAEYDVTAAGFDSRIKGKILNVTNEVQFGLPNLTGQEVYVAGVPAQFARTVGRVNNVDTKVRGIVGDWSKVRFGFASGIELETSDQATITDGSGNNINLFQSGMIALKVTASIGSVVLDDKAFATIVDKA
ncbi:phage major capsid protein [Paeniglutamicibacter sp. NPDC012692]|uniref:phage major capsid protein n=1 Tax=Paeniglutamicibacter sp. NPDC012692 TaxID=3364388 RepID=UPI00369BFB93